MYNGIPTAIPIQPVNPFYVDLNKYSGTWYDVAHLPSFYQPTGAYNTLATYSINSDGTIGVYNTTYYNSTGYPTKYSVYGVGRSVDPNNRRLSITFQPSVGITGPVPQITGYYDIIVVAEDTLYPRYKYAAVSDPEKRSLSLLSRSPYPPSNELQDLIARVASAGYNVAGLEYTYHKHS
ncbi:Lipocalin [Orpheovirus IHUMI-LCC2]|uniref:Lipocalin n=1 Tax=Orpheovirus IHUMI-LCC2 TaxID=2023057 RepID=A0A2I2L3Y4_9VIRU|nr:Lipocalin [Orpheovirus IHUMI-LCC2]SNW62238.1 Lipocalin [Orpheovirus IHUMI-LCC2]